MLSVLPDKIARFLYEYHDTSYTSLGLPPIPLDRSGISVHDILRPDQVNLYYICIICKICTICKNMSFNAYFAYFEYELILLIDCAYFAY